MAMLATLHDRRHEAERQATGVDATIRVDGVPLDALIVNLSASGCLFVCAEPLEVGDTMSIGMTGIGRRQARVVRVLGTRHGAEFEPWLTLSEIEAAVATSDETVIAFPFLAALTYYQDQALQEPERYRIPVRIAICASMIFFSWVLVIIAVHLIV